MTQNLNQFAQTEQAGQLDLSQGSANVFPCMVSANAPASLVAGQAVKIEASAGGPPKVLAITANNDPVFGFVVRNLKDATRAINQPLEIAGQETVMYMTSGGAISRGQAVEYDFVSGNVFASAGVNTVIGYALDQVVNTGDLIRVYITSTPGLPAIGGVKTITVTATLAQINAGLVAIPGQTGRKIQVLNFTEKVTGAFTTNTSVNLQSGTTSVIVEATAQSALTNGAVLLPASSGVTLGAGFAAALPVGESLNVANIGTAAAGGTSITYTITYNYIS